MARDKGFERYWREIAPGRWTRDFDPLEKCLHFSALASPHLVQWTVSFGAILPEITFSVEEIKAAWLVLRHTHPHIACTIQDTGYCYQVPTEEDLEKWLDETVHVDNSGKPGRELAMSLEPPSSSRVVFLPDRREIFFQIRHELIDGVGSTKLLDWFLKTLSEGGKPIPKFGDEASRLSPSIAQLMDAENPPPAVLEEGRKIGERYLSNPAVGLKMESYEAGLPNPGASRLLEHDFSENETSAIIEACKREGYTVTQVTSAAAAAAMLEHSGQETGKFTSFFIADLRDKLHKPPMVGLYVTPGLGVIPLTRSTPFSELVKAAKKEYEWKHNKNNVACHGPMAQMIQDALSMAMANEMVLPAGINISSLGVVEKYLKEPVEDFWINLVVATHLHGGFFVYTVKNRLRFSFCYNEGYFTETSIKEYMDMTVKHLQKGLNIN
ncbi:hypothetical protein H072_10081 [Dactylellina haptotyla CBS 200.50]|uniref:Phthiocerol/phthiodiolone dimycocerosyl transferase C-terminal domain-containing protein n=1 Tax=Dactylellina haptotyla (strain CBS 200.50) TaxID=1284197 RepID=S8A122_DACHA|nr:hypothetical protein H072_10081 [Dactylellina haptotyla CBS 200.50]